MGMKENSLIFKIMMFLFGAVFGWGIVIPIGVIVVVLGLALTGTIIFAFIGIPIMMFGFGVIVWGFILPFWGMKKPQPTVQVL